MSVYYRLVLNSVCRSNHHRIAVMALQHLQDADGDKWRKLFLHHQDAFLEGAKAPDTTFKDFRNHVLHVRDNDWGGAPAAAREWYRRTVRALGQGDWKHAAYCAGVMSHYVCDPVQPFHTGQTEEETTIHRAVEWSFSKAFPELQQILENELGFPDIEIAEGDDWLERMVKGGALVSNQHYETVIDHYDFEVGHKKPEAGLDQELKDVVSALLGYATILLARVLDHAIAESEARAPNTNLVLDTLFAAANIPIRKLLKALDDEKDRDLVEAQYKEFHRTGKVRETLAEDDKVVRALHAEEVLGVSLATLDCQWPRETGTAHGEGAAPRKASKSKPKPAVGSDLFAEPAEAPGEQIRESVEDLMALADAPVEEIEDEIEDVEEETADEADIDEAGEDEAAEIDEAESETEDDAYDGEEDETEESTDLVEYEDDALVEDESDADEDEDQDEEVDAEYDEEDDEDSDEDLAEAYGAPIERDSDAELAAEEDAARAGVRGPSEIRAERIRLRRENLVADAPSIGPKTASRLLVVGVKTVGDLLELAPQEAAKKIKASHINAQVIRDWQSQALLACSVPGISGTTAQLLVGAGVYSPEDMLDADAEFLHEAILEYAESKEGQRLLRGAEAPGLDKVEEWIDAAVSALEDRDAA